MLVTETMANTTNTYFNTLTNKQQYLRYKKYYNSRI